MRMGEEEESPESALGPSLGGGWLEGKGKGKAVAGDLPRTTRNHRPQEVNVIWMNKTFLYGDNGVGCRVLDREGERAWERGSEGRTTITRQRALFGILGASGREIQWAVAKLAAARSGRGYVQSLDPLPTGSYAKKVRLLEYPYAPPLVICELQTAAASSSLVFCRFPLKGRGRKTVGVCSVRGWWDVKGTYRLHVLRN